MKLRKKYNGFTLIELMIVVAIIGILMAIALPQYNKHVLRSYRTAAQAEMMAIAGREQQFFMVNRRYADEITLAANGYTLPTEISARYTYTITVESDTVPSYLINFMAIDQQTKDGDLTLNSEGVKAPADKW